MKHRSIGKYRTGLRGLLQPGVERAITELGGIVGARVFGKFVQHFSAEPGSDQATVFTGVAPDKMCELVEPDIPKGILDLMRDEPAPDVDPSELEVVDYLMLYQRADIEERSGGPEGVSGWFKIREEAFNRAWAPVPLKMRFVQTVPMEIERDGRNHSQLLSDLRTGQREFVDVRQWADFYGADGVLLYIDDIGVGGVNYLMKVESALWGLDWRFGLVDPDSAMIYHSDIHEVGHGMGLAHHRDQGGAGIYEHSYGGACEDRKHGSIQTYLSIAPRRLERLSDGGRTQCPDGLRFSEANDDAVLSHQKVRQWVTTTRLRRDENHGVPVPGGGGEIPPPPPPPPAVFSWTAPAEVTFVENQGAIAQWFAWSVQWKDADTPRSARVELFDVGNADMRKCKYVFGKGFTCEGRIEPPPVVEFEMLGSGRQVLRVGVHRTSDIAEEPRHFVMRTTVEGDFRDTVVTVIDPNYEGTPVNRPPEITPVPDMTITAGESVVIPFAASDPDGDIVTFDITSGPDWVGLQGFAFLAEPPINTVGGDYTVAWTATDSKGAKDNDVFTITVLEPDPWVVINPGLVEENARTGAIRLDGQREYIPA